MRISDWSSDVCSSDLAGEGAGFEPGDLVFAAHPHQDVFTMPAVFGVKLPSDIDTVRAGFMNMCTVALRTVHEAPIRVGEVVALSGLGIIGSLTAHLVRKSAGKLILIDPAAQRRARSAWMRSEEHTSELQSLTRISYA